MAFASASTSLSKGAAQATLQNTGYADLYTLWVDVCVVGVSGAMCVRFRSL